MKKLFSILLVFTTLFITCMSAWASDASALEMDYDALTRNSILRAGSVDATVLDNLALPLTGANGSIITWDSSDYTVITDAGVITRPDFTKSVSLTATLSNGEDEPLSKVFSFRVPGKNESLDPDHPMPVKGELIRKDDFNDNAIDAATITTTGTVAEENGKLHLSGAKDVATSAKIYVKEDKTAVTGNFILEFTLYKNGLYSGIQVGTDAIGGKDYGYFYSREYLYEEGNSLWLRGSSADEDGTYTKFQYATFGNPSTTLKFTILYDSNASTYEVWINNRYAAKRTSMDSGAPDLGYVTFANLGGLATDFYVDDLSCYKVKEDSVGRVVTDEKFEGSTVPSRVVAGSTVTATVQNGALNLVTPASYATSNIYLTDGKAPMAGKFAVEFSIARAAATSRVDAYFLDANNKEAVAVRSWTTTDGVTGGLAAAKGGSLAYTKIAEQSNTIDVYAEFDTVAQTAKLKVNGSNVYEGYIANGYSTISALRIGTVAAVNLTVTKFKVTSLEDGIGNITEHYADSFSDGVVDAGLVKKNDATTITEANGAMNVASGWIKKTFDAPITEKFVAEISLTGSNTDGVHCYFNDANSYFGRVTWHQDGNVYIYNGGTSVTVNNVGTTTLHIKAVVDVPNDKFSVWINGVLARENLPCKNDAESINLFQIETGNATGINVDEVLIYSIKENVLPSVDELSFDYNKYDKKVCVLSPEADECVVVVASYNGSAMVDVVSEEVTLNENGEVLADTSDLNIEGADKIAVFLWNGLTNLRPMCASENITGAISAN